jgi:TrmH family RNA methyltransferase
MRGWEEEEPLTKPARPLSRARQKLLGRLLQRKSREKEGLFLVEGIRSGAEAVEAGADITFAVRSPRALELVGGEALSDRLEQMGVEVAHVTDAELAGFSDADAPQGLLLVCREPDRELAQLSRGAEQRLLLLDGLQDPGNVGTLVRVAAAFGLSGVVALEGTADLYNPKAVRASAGGVFRVPLVRETWQVAGDWMRQHHVKLLVAHPAGVDVARATVAAPWALVVGGEARGVRPELSAAGQLIGIPMPGGSESLNAAVAGSILLYVIAREGSLA